MCHIFWKSGAKEKLEKEIKEKVNGHIIEISLYKMATTSLTS